MTDKMHTAEFVWATPEAEKLITYMARVSNPSNQDAEPGKLIGYLLRNKHWSPFEMVHLCIEVNTTRAIARQLMRHSPRIQEFSQRYAAADVLGSLVLSETRMQHPTNRQMSVEECPEELDAWWQDSQSIVSEYAADVYSRALDKGIAKEQARNVLPEGMTPTRMYMSASIRDWLFLVWARSYEGAQKECRLVAGDILEILKDILPDTVDQFWQVMSAPEDAKKLLEEDLPELLDEWKEFLDLVMEGTNHGASTWSARAFELSNVLKSRSWGLRTKADEIKGRL